MAGRTHGAFTSLQDTVIVVFAHKELEAIPLLWREILSPNLLCHPSNSVGAVIHITALRQAGSEIGIIIGT
jgi:hypothetical protein